MVMLFLIKAEFELSLAIALCPFNITAMSFFFKNHFKYIMPFDIVR